MSYDIRSVFLAPSTPKTQTTGEVPSLRELELLHYTLNAGVSLFVGDKLLISERFFTYLTNLRGTKLRL